MKSFVLFDRKTGEILQTHVQSGDVHRDPTEILQTSRPGKESVTVDVLEVETLTPNTSYRVDIKTKKLIPVDQNKAKGSGGAVVRSTDADPRSARTVIFRIDPRRADEAVKTRVD